MSSDLYFYDSSSYHNYSPVLVSSDGDLFFQDPFSPFCDSSTDIFSESSKNQNNQNPVHNSSSLDHLTPNLLSSSPPSHQLENLSLHSSTHLLQPVGNGENLGGCSSLGNGHNNFYGLDALGIKTEECQMGFESCYNNQPFFIPHSYSNVENVAKMMQRSFSSNSFDGKPGLFFQTPFDALLESPNYQNHALSPPESSFQGHMRRVCSTGDLQNIRTPHSTQRSFSSPLASESSVMEEGNSKVGRYSAEERKDRISKYRAKRNQRNFAKIIKYACRKTLADNRPRIRGRFARHDETGEIPKAACSNRQEEEDELWEFDGLNGEEDDHGGVKGGRDFVNSYEQAQFHYYSY